MANKEKCGNCCGIDRTKKCGNNYLCTYQTERQGKKVYVSTESEPIGYTNGIVFTTWHSCFYWITSAVYSILTKNSSASSGKHLQELYAEKEFLCNLQNTVISINHPELWDQYNILAFKIAQCLYSLPKEAGLEVANTIRNSYFLDIINNPEYTDEDRCFKYILMYQDLLAFLKIDDSVMGLLSDDIPEQIPENLSEIIRSNFEQQGTSKCLIPIDESGKNDTHSAA